MIKISNQPVSPFELSSKVFLSKQGQGGKQLVKVEMLMTLMMHFQESQVVEDNLKELEGHHLFREPPRPIAFFYQQQRQ